MYWSELRLVKQSLSCHVWVYKYFHLQTFFSDRASAANLEGTKSDEPTGGETQHLGFVAGVIERERIVGFERMLWRISRGNVFLRQADIERPFTDPKTVT